MTEFFNDLLLYARSRILPLALVLLGCCVLIVLGIYFLVLARRRKKQRLAQERELELQLRQEEERKKAEAAMEAEKLNIERFRRLEEVIRAQNEQMESMQEQLEAAAKFRHDCRQELLMLREFAADGDRAALENYLPQVQLDQRTAEAPVCRNPMINAIYRAYRAKAEAAGIELDAMVEADESLWLTGTDVGVLFGNLLENAVTAATEAEDGQRRIRIRTTQTEGSLVITMGNTYGGERIFQEDGLFASTKPGHKGIGLDSIRRIARAYDGDVKFGLDEDMFMSCVILFRPVN